MNAITVRTLGGFQLLGDHGDVVPLRSRHEIAAIILLAWNHGRGCTRADLIQFLWPDQKIADARHSLSQLLYRMKRRLPSVDLATENLVEIKSPVQLDVRQLFDAADSSSWRDVIRLYAGRFLQGFNASFSKQFEDWAENLGRSVDQAVRLALQARLDQSVSEGDWLPAARYVDHLLEFDPQDIRLRIEKAMVLAQLGDFRRAVHAANRLPGRHRRRAIRSIRDVANGCLETVQRQSSLAQPRFVGRRAEFREVIQYWSEVATGSGRVVLVSGEPGIGKTRFCEHLLRHFAIKGDRVLLARCVAFAQNVPLSTISELLKQIKPSSGLHGFCQRVLQSSSSAWQAHEDCATQFLNHVTRKGRAVVWVDDMQWIDASSFGFFLRVFESMEGYPLLVLLSFRRNEVEERGLGLLERVGTGTTYCRHLALPELGKEDAFSICDQFEASSGFAVDTVARDALFARIGGRPFFLIETLRELLNQKAPITEVGSLPLSQRVADFLASRIATVGPTTRAVLDAMCVMGTSATADLLSEIVGFDADVVIASCEELRAKHLASDAGRGMQPAHELIRSVVLDDLGSHRRASLHSRVADVLKRRGCAPASILAEHYDESNAQALAFRNHCDAANTALRLNAFREAEHHINRATKAAGSEGEYNIVLALRAELCFRTRRLTEAKLAYRALGSWFSDLGDRRGMFRGRSVSLLADLADGARPATELLQEALGVIEEGLQLNDDLYLAESLSMVAQIAYDMGDREFLTQFLPRMYVAGQSLRDDWSAAVVLAGCSTVHAVLIDAYDARRIALAALDRANRAGSPPAVARANFALGSACLASGALQEAERHLRYAIDVAQRAGAVGVARSCYNNYAVTLMERGMVAEAETLIQRELTETAAHERLFMLGNLILCMLEGGRYSAVLDICERLSIDNSRYRVPWINAVVAFARGTALQSHSGPGTGDDAAAAVIDEFLNSPKSVTSDRSYFDIFIARTDFASGRVDAALERLEKSIAANARTQVLGCMRLRIERAKILSVADRNRARRALLEVLDEAEAIGAVLVAQAAQKSLFAIGTK